MSCQNKDPCAIKVNAKHLMFRDVIVPQFEDNFFLVL